MAVTFTTPREGETVEVQILSNTMIDGRVAYKGMRIAITHRQFLDLAASGKCRKLDKSERVDDHDFDEHTLKVLPPDLKPKRKGE